MLNMLCSSETFSFGDNYEVKYFRKVGVIYVILIKQILFSQMPSINQVPAFKCGRLPLAEDCGAHGLETCIMKSFPCNIFRMLFLGMTSRIVIILLPDSKSLSQTAQD